MVLDESVLPFEQLMCLTQKRWKCMMHNHVKLLLEAGAKNIVE